MSTNQSFACTHRGPSRGRRICTQICQLAYNEATVPLGMGGVTSSRPMLLQPTKRRMPSDGMVELTYRPPPLNFNARQSPPNEISTLLPHAPRDYFALAHPHLHWRNDSRGEWHRTAIASFVAESYGSNFCYCIYQFASNYILCR